MNVFDGPSLSSSSRSATRFDLRDAMDDTDDNGHVLGTSLILPGARAGDEGEEMEVEEEEEEGANHSASVSDVIDGDDFDENDQLARVRGARHKHGQQRREMALGEV